MLKKTIVFVCRGNIARSSIAEFLLKEKLKKEGLGNRYTVLSRGTQGTSVDPVPVKYPNVSYYDELWSDIKPSLKAHDIDIVSSHTSQKITESLMRKAVVVFAMDEKTQKALTRLFPTEKNKIYLFSELVGVKRSIKDPESISGSSRQAQVVKYIAKTIEQGTNKLLVLLGDD